MKVSEKVLEMRKQRKSKQFIRQGIFTALLCVVLVLIGVSTYSDYLIGNDVSRTIHHSPETMCMEGEILGEDRETVSVSTQSYQKKEAPLIGEEAKTLKEDIKSEYAIIVREGDDMILLDKYATERMYPASLTKMMTALVALERSKDLNTEYIVSKTIKDSLEGRDASEAGFLSEERVRTIDLLYGVLLPSGAECCLTLAQNLAGSEEEFVNWMNEKAEELGMKDTHFVNSTGLHDENHYSTAYDMAILLKEVEKKDLLREIMGSPKHVVPPTNKHTDGITIYNSMYTKMEKEDTSSAYILGGKTGYTPQAGLCLASFGEVNGIGYYVITAAANGNYRTKQNNILDSLSMYSMLSKK